MRNYKSIVTITWKFESDKGDEGTLDYAKEQIARIMNCDPQGDEFADFSVQVAITPLKDAKKLKHIHSYDLDEIFPYVTTEDKKQTFVVDGEPYIVKMNSDRYQVFKENRFCVACGIEGKQMVLDINPGDHSPHFNLYGEENGRLVLMTKDHIIPKSQGGGDELGNIQTMCHICNNLKGCHNLTLEQIRELRQLCNNEDKISKKKLRELVNSRREDMVRVPIANQISDSKHVRKVEETVLDTDMISS
jgi:5-methylcytosine-specific restriction endonuclease McrA